MPRPGRLKVCATPSCPELVPKGQSYCPECRKARDRNRGTAWERGYNAEHQARRRQWEPKVEAGGVNCARCGEPIKPGELWDLDHADDGSGYLGPSHARCNRATAGRPARPRDDDDEPPRYRSGSIDLR